MQGTKNIKRHKFFVTRFYFCYTGSLLYLTRRFILHLVRGELSYLAPLGSENISAPISSSVSVVGVYYPQAESNATPPSLKTEITNILFYILNFASIMKFKM
jgi:hypothetical protein